MGSPSPKKIVGAAVGGVVGFVTGGPAGALRGAALGYTLFGTPQGQPGGFNNGSIASDANTPDTGQLATAIGEGAWVPKAYGNRRGGMVLVATDVMNQKTNDSTFNYQIIDNNESGSYATSVYVLGEGPWNKITQLYYNNNPLFAEGSNISFNTRYEFGNPIWNTDQGDEAYGNLEVQFIQGNRDQNTASMLTEVQLSPRTIADNTLAVTVDDQRWFSSTDSGSGICYMVLRIRRDKDAIIRETAPTSLVVDAEAKLVPDVRLEGSPLVYSTNPGLIALDQLRGIYDNNGNQTNIFSFGLRDNEIDFDSFVNFANYCDNPNEYNNQSPFTLNGQFRQGTTIKGILEDIGLATGALFEDTSGIVRVQIDKSEPVANGIRITSDNVIGNFNRTEPKTSELANAINVRYINEFGQDIIDVVQFPEADIEAEGRKEADLDLRMVQTSAQAIEMGKRALYAQRSATFEFNLDLTGYNLDVFNVCNIDDMLDTDIVAEESLIRIFSVTKQRAGGGSRPPVRVSAKLYNPQQYDNPEGNDGIAIVPSTAIFSDAPSTTSIPTPENVSVERISDTTAKVSWNFVGDYQTQIQTRINGSGDPFSTKLTVISDDSADIDLIEPGTYDVAVRFVSENGSVGQRTIVPYASSGLVLDTSEKGIVPLDDTVGAFIYQFGEVVYADDARGTNIRKQTSPNNEIQQLLNHNYAYDTPVAARLDSNFTGSRFQSFTLDIPSDFNAGEATRETYRIAYNPSAVGGDVFVGEDRTPINDYIPNKYGWSYTDSTLSTPYYPGMEDDFRIAYNDIIVQNAGTVKVFEVFGGKRELASVTYEANTSMNEIMTQLYLQIFSLIVELRGTFDEKPYTVELDTINNILHFRFHKFEYIDLYNFVLEDENGDTTDIDGGIDDEGSGPQKGNAPPKAQNEDDENPNFLGCQYAFLRPEDADGLPPPGDLPDTRAELPCVPEQQGQVLCFNPSEDELENAGSLSSDLVWTETTEGSGVWTANPWDALINGEENPYDTSGSPTGSVAALATTIAQGQTFLGAPNSDCSNTIVEYSPGGVSADVRTSSSLTVTNQALEYISGEDIFGNPTIDTLPQINDPQTGGVYVTGPGVTTLIGFERGGFTGVVGEDKPFGYIGNNQQAFYVVGGDGSLPDGVTVYQGVGHQIIHYEGGLTGYTGGTVSGILTSFHPTGVSGNADVFDVTDARIVVGGGVDPNTTRQVLVFKDVKGPVVCGGQTAASPISDIIALTDGTPLEGSPLTAEDFANLDAKNKAIIYINAQKQAIAENAAGLGFGCISQTGTSCGGFTGDPKFPQFDQYIGDDTVVWAKVSWCQADTTVGPEDKTDAATAPIADAVDVGQNEDGDLTPESIASAGEPPAKTRFRIDFSNANSGTEKNFIRMINSVDEWSDEFKTEAIDVFNANMNNQQVFEYFLPFNLDAPAIYENVKNTVESTFKVGDTPLLTVAISNLQIIIRFVNSPYGLTEGIGDASFNNIYDATIEQQISNPSFYRPSSMVEFSKIMPVFDNLEFETRFDVNIDLNEINGNGTSPDNMVAEFGLIYAAEQVTDSDLLPLEGVQPTFRPIPFATGAQLAQTIVDQVNTYWSDIETARYVASYLDNSNQLLTVDTDTANSINDSLLTNMIEIAYDPTYTGGQTDFFNKSNSPLGPITMTLEGVNSTELGFRNIRTPFYRQKNFIYNTNNLNNNIRNDHVGINVDQYHTPNADAQQAITDFDTALANHLNLDNPYNSNGFYFNKVQYDSLDEIQYSLTPRADSDDASMNTMNFDFVEITNEEIPDWMIGDTIGFNTRYEPSWAKNLTQNVLSHKGTIKPTEFELIYSDIEYEPYQEAAAGFNNQLVLKTPVPDAMTGDSISTDSNLTIPVFTVIDDTHLEFNFNAFNDFNGFLHHNGGTINIYRFNSETKIYKDRNSEYYLWKRSRGIAPDQGELIDLGEDQVVRGWTIASDPINNQSWWHLFNDTQTINQYSQLGSELKSFNNVLNDQFGSWARFSPNENFNVVFNGQLDIYNDNRWVGASSSTSSNSDVIKVDYIMRINDSVDMSINLNDNLDQDGNPIATRSDLLRSPGSVNINQGLIGEFINGTNGTSPIKDNITMTHPTEGELLNMNYWDYPMDNTALAFVTTETQSDGTILAALALLNPTREESITRVIQSGGYLFKSGATHNFTEILEVVSSRSVTYGNPGDFPDVTTTEIIVRLNSLPNESTVFAQGVDLIGNRSGFHFSANNGIAETANSDSHVRLSTSEHTYSDNSSDAYSGTPYGHRYQIFDTVRSDFNNSDNNLGIEYSINGNTHNLTHSNNRGIDGYVEWFLTEPQLTGVTIRPNLISQFGILEPFTVIPNVGIGFDQSLELDNSDARISFYGNPEDVPTFNNNSVYRVTYNPLTLDYRILSIDRDSNTLTLDTVNGLASTNLLVDSRTYDNYVIDNNDVSRYITNINGNTITIAANSQTDSAIPEDWTTETPLFRKQIMEYTGIDSDTNLVVTHTNSGSNLYINDDDPSDGRTTFTFNPKRLLQGGVNAAISAGEPLVGPVFTQTSGPIVINDGIAIGDRTITIRNSVFQEQQPLNSFDNGSSSGINERVPTFTMWSYNGSSGGNSDSVVTNIVTAKGYFTRVFTDDRPTGAFTTPYYNFNINLLPEFSEQTYTIQSVNEGNNEVTLNSVAGLSSGLSVAINNTNPNPTIATIVEINGNVLTLDSIPSTAWAEDAEMVYITQDNTVTQEMIDIINADQKTYQWNKVEVKIATEINVDRAWNTIQDGGNVPAYYGVRSRETLDELCSDEHIFEGVSIPGVRPRTNERYPVWKSSFLYFPILDGEVPSVDLNPQYRIKIRRRPEFDFLNPNIRTSEGYREIPTLSSKPQTGSDRQYIINGDALTLVNPDNLTIYIDEPNGILTGAFQIFDTNNTRYVLARMVNSNDDIPTSPATGNTVYLDFVDSSTSLPGIDSPQKNTFYSYRGDTGEWIVTPII